LSRDAVVAYEQYLLYKLDNNSLAKVSSTLELTNKLLQEIENRKILPSNDFRVAIPDINFQKHLTIALRMIVDLNHIDSDRDSIIVAKKLFH
jgi:hypothetical protein